MPPAAATPKHEPEEGIGLVSSTDTTPPLVADSESNTSSSRLSGRHLAAFICFSVVLLALGYLAGKDSGSSALRTHLHDMYGNDSEDGEGGKQAAPPRNKPAATPTAPKSPPPPPLRKYSAAALQEAKAAAQDTLRMLEEYYGEHASKVLKGDVAFGFGFSAGADGNQPANAVSFARHVSLVARALVHGEPLKLGFIGSSVMCGHDNCYYDSFPSQLDRLLAPVFTKAQNGVVMRNACQGGGCGDSYDNQIFCFRHMVGDDVDFVFYEWTYFENGEAWHVHDAIARWAAMLAKGAATILFHCDKDAWGNKQLEEKWAAYGSNSVNLEGGLRQGKYVGKEWGAVGDGLHSTTRYGELAEPQRRKSLGVVFRNWHPGPLGLQYIADLSAYMLLRATVQAVDDILAAGEGAEAKWPKVPVDHPPLPAPSFTRKDNPLLYEVYTRLEEEPPGCLTVQAKTFGRAIVSVSDKHDDPLNPYSSKVVKLGSQDTAWRLWEAGVNWDMVPRDERAMGDMCQPPDRCGYFTPPAQETAPLTPIVFRLPKMVVGLIVLCGSHVEWGKHRLSTPKLRRSFHAEFDGKALNPDDYVVFPNRKCVAIQQRFTGPLDNKNGHLYLSLTTTDPEFKISQVITA